MGAYKDLIAFMKKHCDKCTRIVKNKYIRERVFYQRTGQTAKYEYANKMYYHAPERLKITWSNKPRLSSSHQKQTLTNILVTSIPRLMMVMMMQKSVMKSLNLMLENSMKCGLRLRTITQLKNKDFLN